MKVWCEIQEDELDSDRGLVQGVRAVCSECGHETESSGTSERSIKRCLALMRKECPEGTSNLYVTEEEDDDDGGFYA
jgi:hypothetical protein